MFVTCVLALALASSMPADPPFPLRTDPPPKEWRSEEINQALPLHWEPGTVHVLAWERLADDRPFEYTQILVLKWFDQPTEDGGHRWVLVHLYRDPETKERPWRGPMRIPPPYPADEPVPELTEAQLYGWEFYGEPPTDDQVQTFLRETDWTPVLGTNENSVGEGNRPVTTKLSAGGVDRAVWEEVFGREVPDRLFPELRRPAAGRPR